MSLRDGGGATFWRWCSLGEAAARRARPGGLANELEKRYNGRVEFRILGPLEVTGGDGAISFDAPKQRALLGVLLLHPNDVVSSERLIDELWGERPPATAAKVVQKYVSQLRKAVGAELIVTRPPGYVLRVEEDGLDAARFRHLASEGRRVAANGEQERAYALYREALALWRGPPLADVVFGSSARNEVARLEEERLAALMDRIDCELALGRHDELVAELETLVGQHPLRERLRRQLMLALYRSGRQADALAAYQEARRALVDELGLEPGGELQALERAILTHDAALEAPPRVPRERTALGRALSWRVVAVAALVLIAIASGLAFALRGGEPAPTLLASNSVGFIDAESGRVTDSFPVGREPSSLIVAYDSLWVANYRDQTVSRIDRASGRTIATISVSGHPTGITSYRGTIWVWTLEGVLVPIDPAYNSPGKPVSLAREIIGRRGATGRITAGGGYLWISAPHATVIRVDAANTRNRKAIVPPGGVTGAIVYRDGNAWVAGADRVFPIAAETGVAGSGAEAGLVGDFAFGAGSLWAVSGTPSHLGGIVQALRRVDTHTGLVQETIAVGSTPVAVAVAAGSIWVAAGSDIERVDPAQDRVVGTIAVGAKPTALAATGDGIWVAVG